MGLLLYIWNSTWDKDKPANRYKCTCQAPYPSTFLADLQKDSDDEEIILKPGEKIVFPPSKGAHFSRFIVKHRNTDDIEEVKEVLNAFEKDDLLLTLIPIAFDIDMETQTQLNSLFVDKENALSTIWEFILISFRYYGSPGGLHKTTHDDFLRLDSYYLEHATLLIESSEQIIDIFIYCVNRNDNLREARRLEQSTPVDNSNQPDMDVTMDDTNVPGALSAQESSSLRDLTL